MNGWYLHQPMMAWPPSPDIVPLLTSVHFTPALAQHWENAGEAREYLQKHAPIGCRDSQTLGQMKKLGIPAYFSGCMTLTLPGWDLPRTDEIVLVNVSPETRQHVEALGLPCRVVTQDCGELPDMPVEQRLEQAESLLKIYQSAKCVVTSRLHCALPCLALKTPVLVEYQDSFEARFAGLGELLRLASKSEIARGDWDAFLSDPEPNSEAYLPLREKLIRQCEAFVSDSVEVPASPRDEAESYEQLLRRYAALYRHNRPIWENWFTAEQMMKNQEEAWGFVRKYEKDTAEKDRQYKRLREQLEETERQRDRLRKELQELPQCKEALSAENERLERERAALAQTVSEIRDSRTWKWMQRMSKLLRK